MSVETQYIIVDPINKELVRLGLPDTCGDYHQVQLTWEQANHLAQKIMAASGKETHRRLMEQVKE